jgi:DNA-binding MarR family transcriptional regulator
LLDLDKTTITRPLKPLLQKRWLALEVRKDGREKWVTLTMDGQQQIERARPAWDRAQARMRKALPTGLWELFIRSLPKLADLSGRA